MVPFASFGQTCVTIFTKAIAKMKYAGVYHEIDVSRRIADKIREYTGLSCSVRTTPLAPWLPQLNRVTYTVRTTTNTIHGTSNHTDANVALIKASGEILERISLFSPLSSFRNEGNATFLKKLSNKKLTARSLIGLRFKSFLANTVYYGLPPPENQMGLERNTNGCAAHFDRRKAIVSAVLELIERDAFLVHWMHSCSPKVITVSESSENSVRIRHILRAFDMYKLEYHFFDISSDIDVPVCLAMVGKASETGMRYFFGASAGFDIDDVIMNAASEALSVMHSRYPLDPFVLEENYIPFTSKKIGQSERMRLYFTDAMNEHLAFLLSSSTTISPVSFITRNGVIAPHIVRGDAKKYSYLMGIFSERYKKDNSWDIFIIDYSNALLSEFGYHVVRVVCDALVPLYLRECNAKPDHKRYEQFGKARGISGKRNSWPHPFP